MLDRTSDERFAPEIMRKSNYVLAAIFLLVEATRLTNIDPVTSGQFPMLQNLMNHGVNAGNKTHILIFSNSTCKYAKLGAITGKIHFW
jgi:hypothetical protein